MFISSHAPLRAGYYWLRPTGYATVLIRPVPLRGRAATGSVNRAMQLRILAVPCAGWLPLAPPPRVSPPTRKWGKTRWVATELNVTSYTVETFGPMLRSTVTTPNTGTAAIHT